MIYEDSDHDLYFSGQRLAFISDLSMTTFRRLQPGTPLDGNDGMFVVEDREKWLWLGTNNGLFRYDKKDCFIPYNLSMAFPVPYLLFVRRCVMRMAFGLETPKGFCIWMQCG